MRAPVRRGARRCDRNAGTVAGAIVGTIADTIAGTGSLRLLPALKGDTRQVSLIRPERRVQGGIDPIVSRVEAGDHCCRQRQASSQKLVLRASAELHSAFCPFRSVFCPLHAVFSHGELECR
jgi:hypothetical protein